MNCQESVQCTQCAKPFSHQITNYCGCGCVEGLQPLHDAKAYSIQVFSYVPNRNCDHERLPTEYIHESCIPKYEIANSKIIRNKVVEERFINVLIPREKRDDEIEYTSYKDYLIHNLGEEEALAMLAQE